ncbi:MAG: hypothetical protein ACOC4C_00750 [Fibrobacterota bacterium]
MFSLILCVGLVFFSGCASSHQKIPRNLIDVENKTIRLQGLLGLNSLSKCNAWPDDSGQQQALITQVEKFYSRIVSHLQHQQKNGLYTTVDSTHPADMILEFSLSSHCFSAETLNLSLTVAAHDNHVDSTRSFTIHAWGLTDTLMEEPFKRIGVALADYRRRFPYSAITDNFINYSAETR